MDISLRLETKISLLRYLITAGWPVKGQLHSPGSSRGSRRTIVFT